MRGAQDGGQDSAPQVLAYVLGESLKLLHPFAPHITEEIYQALPTADGVLMVQQWPEPDGRLRFKHETAEMELLMDAVRAVRSRRNEMKIPPSKKAAWTVETQHTELFKAHTGIFKALAGASDVTFGPAPEGSVSVITGSATIALPLAELVDPEAEKSRIAKERAALEKELAALETKLDNPGFTGKAPEKIVAAERERLAALRDKLERL
jgi:valyl-tRNA synthetase